MAACSEATPGTILSLLTLVGLILVNTGVPIIREFSMIRGDAGYSTGLWGDCYSVTCSTPEVGFQPSYKSRTTLGYLVVIHIVALVITFLVVICGCCAHSRPRKLILRLAARASILAIIVNVAALLVDVLIYQDLRSKRSATLGNAFYIEIVSIGLQLFAIVAFYAGKRFINRQKEESIHDEDASSEIHTGKHEYEMNSGSQTAFPKSDETVTNNSNHSTSYLPQRQYTTPTTIQRPGPTYSHNKNIEAPPVPYYGQNNSSNPELLRGPAVNPGPHYHSQGSYPSDPYVPPPYAPPYAPPPPSPSAPEYPIIDQIYHSPPSQDGPNNQNIWQPSQQHQLQQPNRPSSQQEENYYYSQYDGSQQNY